jgi:uncharacterized protein
MECPGIVTHVTSFGAFVDIGVQHDGLVHVSQLQPRPGRGPKEGVHPGDRLLVRVLKVDLEKKQISLTMRKPAPQRKPAPPRRPAARVREQPATPRRAEAPVRPLPERPSPRRRPAGRPSPERPRPARPERQPSADKRPDSRRPAFNNPFAVLAGLKVPPKRDKS